MAAIKTEELTKQYDGVTAVQNLDLTVQEGEVFGFLGPNGAGKSTTINVLLDFVRPTSGHVSVLGHDPRTGSRAIRNRIGILPEGYSLYDRLSAREHIKFAIEMEESDDDPRAVLDRVGLADDAGRSVGGFSKGMGQRLALGMALVGKPDLLILDEPTSGLDPSGTLKMREIVREEVDRGATVFFSSHLLDQVEAICDRVGIMTSGELVTVDSVEGLRESVGAESTLILTVDDRPGSLDLETIKGVTGVTINGATLRVSCSEPGVKAAVISQVQSAGATVTDITTEETSLEDVFEKYTANGIAMEPDA
ncbi:ABC transporter ATP-binding protein [Haloprofundus salinisoli]|uniref:ABC transporter ATP-binding protein n=1 Tax=Haloprofundus salinisoli TaxID=2876193 RepID=UPI001CC97DF0|nr:ABC transporter ATP-binding protein [Haloprofundus salinisoli]